MAGRMTSYGLSDTLCMFLASPHESGYDLEGGQEAVACRQRQVAQL